ncbi:MAG TPA: helix-turn-helix domain-containing protein [Acidimicrobiales bacterium]|nr:helix-turn-helix domain-containing protein [Acidimicrobiales bacterium]
MSDGRTAPADGEDGAPDGVAAAAAPEAELEGDRDGSLAGRIGRRLRNRRKELGLTLADTAERSSLSISYLSAVEKGVNLPSLPTLVKLTDALETSIPAVLVEEGANRVMPGRLPGAGSDAVDLSHAELRLRTLAVRAGAGEESMLALPTKDHDVFCYLVDGELEVALDEREPIVLHAGDALDVRSASTIFWSTRPGALAVWTSCPVRV